MLYEVRNMFLMLFSVFDPVLALYRKRDLMHQAIIAVSKS